MLSPRTITTAATLILGPLAVTLLCLLPTAVKADVVFVSESGSTNMHRYNVNPSGTPTAMSSLTANIDVPSDIAVSGWDELFVSNRVDPTPVNAGFDYGHVARFLSPLSAAPTSNGTIPDIDGVPKQDFGGPFGAAFRGSELFTVNAGKANVLRFTFDGSGGAVAGTPIGLGGSDGRYCAVSPWGELFVSRQSVNLIERYKFDVAGNASSNGTISGGSLNNVHGLSFNADGELFAVNASGSSSNHVSRFTFTSLDETGTAMAGTPFGGTGPNVPIDLAFTSWGELLVTSVGGSGGITRFAFDAAGNPSEVGTFAAGTKFEGIEAAESQPTTGYPGTVLADGPIGYWRLGESAGPKAYDAAFASGVPQQGSQNGDYTGGVTLGTPGALGASGDMDTAATFDGSNDYVNIPAGEPDTGTVFDFGVNDPFTLEAWINTSTASKEIEAIVSKYVGSTGYFMALFNPGTNDPDGWQLIAQVQGGGVYAYKHGNGGATPLDSLADGEWHQVVVTHAGGGEVGDLTLFVDGLELTETGSGGSGATALINSATLKIGANKLGSAQYFTGSIDEVAVYNRVLTDDEILEHFNAAIPEPSTLVLLVIGVVFLGLLRRRRR